MKWLLLALLALSTLSLQATDPNQVEQQIIDFYETAHQPKILRLWPESSERNQSRNGKPEAAALTNKLRVNNTGSPSVLVYPPPEGVTNAGIMMLFCPGGAYAKLAMSNPREFTEWMNHLGITVATLKYHVPRHSNDTHNLWPLADAQRAMRILRSQADNFKVDPEKIGIVGSSAGGHLAMNVCVNHAQSAYQTIDQLDKLSCRPAFGFLYYPAYLAQNKQSLTLNPSWHAERINKSQTPPIFITINGDDGFITSSLRATLELNNAKVPSELHVWTKGGHGGCTNKYPLVEHIRPGIRFLVKQNILPESLIEKSDQWLNQKVKELVASSPTPPKAIATSSTPPQPITDLTLIDSDIQKRQQQALSVYRLWPNKGTREDDPLKTSPETIRAKGFPGGSQVTIPTMTYFPAAAPTGRAVLVFPGGAYKVLAYQHEGTDLCHWLNQQGISAFLVKYRTPRRKGLAKHAVALQDAHRAVRLVRSQAKQFSIDPDQIGVLGFSAGGHLCALATTPSDHPSYPKIDDHDKVSPSPDFGILIYPAYSTVENKPETVDPVLVTKKPPTTPLFVATAQDDRWTTGQLYFLHQRYQQKQPIEYHIYQDGGHGKGLNHAKSHSFDQWSRDCKRWLSELKIANAKSQKPKT